MAWVNNKWLTREERQELINTTKEIIDVMLDADNLTYDETIELDNYIKELERLERIHRGEVDLLYFSIEYFSERYNPGNQGNWEDFDVESAEQAPDFHKEICSRMDEISQFEKNAKDATAAPRSHAKSTYLSRAEPLREVVYRLRNYIIMISETPTVAKSNLDWISGQLKTNRKLREDFGPLLHPKQQMNIKDNDNEFIAAEPNEEGAPSHEKQLTLVQAASTGQALRGRNWNGKRPDLVIADDLEDSRPGGNASTAEARAKLKDWFTQIVMALGGPMGKRTAYIYMGTIVHRESLLNDVIHNRSDFKSRLYKALIEEPERMDLWEQCESIYKDINLEKEERLERATAFYQAHKEEMDKGAVVLWPEAKPIFELMLWKWDNGSKAFNTEMQNVPRDEESMTFNPDNFYYFTDEDLVDSTGRPLPLDYYGFWDVATGKSKRTDYNAIVTIARNRVTGAMFIVDAWAKKCPIKEAQDMVIKKIEQFGHKMFGVETIGVGHDQYNQIKSRLMKERIYGTIIKAVSSHSEKNKEKRIENMEPLVESGFLRFRKQHKLLISQLEEFPTASHDDLPDALAGAVNLSGGARRTRRTYRKKPAGV
ncbi:phage terminase large subunit [Ornithinibacillus sp. JPR2-1]|uniref:phage terminase large subunit n=1 Tax=Ornithinibacillus sp. JPR2-1 TaxID=2094019 RepID=UPI0031D9391E